MAEKVKTGIKGLDKILRGGLPKQSIVLLSGTPGTGKSILCSQILYDAALNGKKCLYLNLEQNSHRLEEQMRGFGWDAKKVKKNLKIAAVDSSNPEIVEFVLDEVQKTNYDLIALDSLDSISSTPLETEELGKMSMAKVSESVIPTVLDIPTVGRLKLKKIFTAIANSKATALLTSEKVENALGFSRDTISEFLCDTIIVLTYSSVAGGANRTLEIRKNRLSKFDEGIMPMEITGKGLVVTPLEEEKL